MILKWLKPKTRFVEWSAASIQGARAEQQDAFQVINFPGTQDLLLALADGMGGHSGGGIASRAVIDSVVSTFLELKTTDSPPQSVFPSMIEIVNDHLRTLQASDENLSDMGSTLVVAYLSATSVVWISVGDSPMWLLRNGKLIRLNEDHSLRSHKQAAESAGGVLFSAINGRPPTVIDCPAVPSELLVGDKIVMASDGLLTLAEDDIARIVGDQSKDLSGIVYGTLHEIEARGKSNQDNCTLIVAEIVSKVRNRSDRQMTSFGG